MEVTLASAIDCSASDIMFQSVSTNRTLRIKFKEDGDWTEPVELGDIGQNVLSFLKTQARLDTSKSDRPQDGQFRREYENREYLFRINTTFNFNMETAILRLQPDINSIPTHGGIRNGALSLYRDSGIHCRPARIDDFHGSRRIR